MPESLIGLLYRHDGGRLDGRSAGTAVGRSAIRPAVHMTDPSPPMKPVRTGPSQSGWTCMTGLCTVQPSWSVQLCPAQYGYPHFPDPAEIFRTFSALRPGSDSLPEAVSGTLVWKVETGDKSLTHDQNKFNSY
ncbi:hypothetical protein PGT21_029439 [Puccinia graminis f. sp. tritici]|uniref:Uncharacterized protein n=1 Tax=Puccinia graminis f. sp. tritici TaxID=56615 RepID=A0A5B0MQH8_PUCGR|nr:hypothetical protein PGT21_029439 [Puccinia graminis f. sp. tritici]